MTVIEAPPLLHKTMSVSGIKVLDDEQGIVEAFVAGIGNKDSTGDIIVSGAFDESLLNRTPKGVWSHDWSRWVSKTLEIYEVKVGDPRLPVKMSSRGVGGLYVKTQFNLNTQDGREAFENVKFFGDESEWSIGYMEIETEYSKDAQANLLIKIDLYEYSPVLFGANSLTSTVSVKVSYADDACQIQVTGLGKDLEAQVSKAVADVLKGTEGKKEEDVTTETKVDDVAEATDTKEGDAPEEKVVPGSMEARYSALMQALSEEYPNGYTFPVATFTDSVVYEVFSFSGAEEEGTFQRSYSMDDDGSVTFGEPKAVDVVEVIVEKIGGPEALEAKGGSIEALREKIDLVEKAGRVLSVKNSDRLSQAKTLIDEVLDSGTKATEEDASSEEEKTAETDEVEEKTDEVETLDIKALTETLQSLVDAVAKLNPAEEAVEEKTEDSEEKAANEDPDDAATHHEYVKGDQGMCKICGEAEKAAVHTKITGDDEDDEGAGDEAEKGVDDTFDVTDLLAELGAELSLIDSFLPKE